MPRGPINANNKKSRRELLLEKIKPGDWAYGRTYDELENCSTFDLYFKVDGEYTSRITKTPSSTQLKITPEGICFILYQHRRNKTTAVFANMEEYRNYLHWHKGQAPKAPPKTDWIQSHKNCFVKESPTKLTDIRVFFKKKNMETGKCRLWMKRDIPEKHVEAAVEFLMYTSKKKNKDMTKSISYIDNFEIIEEDNEGSNGTEDEGESDSGSRYCPDSEGEPIIYEMPRENDDVSEHPFDESDFDDKSSPSTPEPNVVISKSTPNETSEPAIVPNQQAQALITAPQLPLPHLDLNLGLFDEDDVYERVAKRLKTEIMSELESMVKKAVTEVIRESLLSMLTPKS
jgi:hypothetical protein